LGAVSHHNLYSLHCYSYCLFYERKVKNIALINRWIRLFADNLALEIRRDVVTAYLGKIFSTKAMKTDI
jgi:hypothetical protein